MDINNTWIITEDKLVYVRSKQSKLTEYCQHIKNKTRKFGERNKEKNLKREGQVKKHANLFWRAIMEK